MSEAAGPYLSVIIPAFNESKRIGPTLDRIDTYLNAQPYSSEVIVVDDFSTDDTSATVSKNIAAKSRFRLVHNDARERHGKGGAVRFGMMMARGRYKIFSDADLSTPIEEVAKFLPIIDSGGVVIGSRRLKGAVLGVRQPVHREAAGRLFSLLVRLLTLKGLLDTQCGFKMFTAKAAEEIFKRQTIFKFGFDVEILFIAQKLGYGVVETPVVWYDSPQTKVHLFRDSTIMFLDLLRIRSNDKKNLYA